MSILFTILMLWTNVNAGSGPGDPVPPQYHRGFLRGQAGATTVILRSGIVEFILDASVLSRPENKSVQLNSDEEIRLFYGDEDLLKVHVTGR